MRFRWYCGTQGGTERVIARVLPNGRHYLYLRIFGKKIRFIF